MFHVLKDINFEVKRGEFFGVVGRNGSGKSTLLKTLGGIYSPTKGSVEISGTLTPFIELGIGFNPELTGRDNVFLNGAILGLTRREILQKYDDIVAFAELEQFMDQKLKNYSSGMQVRLAFSIAMQAHNDILLIDEVLAVGDAAFQRKCYNVFKDMKKTGKTVIFVTHDMAAVEEYCDRAMLIEKSEIKVIGRTSIVTREYNRILNGGPESHKIGKRMGDRLAEITAAKITTLDSKKMSMLSTDVEEFWFEMTVRFNTPITHPIFGVTIRDAAGSSLIVSNTKADRIETGTYAKGEMVHVRWKLRNIFNKGSYSFSPAIAAQDAVTMHDWRDDLVWLDVEKDNSLPGPLRYDYHINISKGNQ